MMTWQERKEFKAEIAALRKRCDNLQVAVTRMEAEIEKSKEVLERVTDYIPVEDTGEQLPSEGTSE